VHVAACQELGSEGRGGCGECAREIETRRCDRTRYPLRFTLPRARAFLVAERVPILRENERKQTSDPCGNQPTWSTARTRTEAVTRTLDENDNARLIAATESQPALRSHSRM